MHNLDILAKSHSSRSTLRSLGHHSNLLLEFFGAGRLVEVSHSDRGSNGVEVRGLGLGSIYLVLLSLVQGLLDHLKAVCIDPELFVGVKTVHQEPVDNNIFTTLVLADGDLVGRDLELNEIVKSVQVNFDVSANLLLIWFILEFVLFHIVLFGCRS